MPLWLQGSPVLLGLALFPFAVLVVWLVKNERRDPAETPSVLRRLGSFAFQANVEHKIEVQVRMRVQPIAGEAAPLYVSRCASLMGWMMTEPFNWIGPTLILLALGVTLYWYRNGPSIKTKSRISSALEARGLQLISVKPQLELRLGAGSRVPLVARVRNGFGNVHTVYFDVDIWADLFLPQPNVRELGTYQSSRFMSAGDQ